MDINILLPTSAPGCRATPRRQLLTVSLFLSLSPLLQNHKLRTRIISFIISFLLRFPPERLPLLSFKFR
jgi:hypothetical protein